MKLTNLTDRAMCGKKFAQLARLLARCNLLPPPPPLARALPYHPAIFSFKNQQTGQKFSKQLCVFWIRRTVTASLKYRVFPSLKGTWLSLLPFREVLKKRRFSKAQRIVLRTTRLFLEYFISTEQFNNLFCYMNHVGKEITKVFLFFLNLF